MIHRGLFLLEIRFQEILFVELINDHDRLILSSLRFRFSFFVIVFSDYTLSFKWQRSYTPL